MKMLLPVVLVALATASGPLSADEDAPSGDLAKLQGDWQAQVGPDKDIVVHLTLKGHAATVTMTGKDGREFVSHGEIKLDETAKLKAIDWVKFTKANGEPAADNLAIYEFVGEDVRFCSGGLGKDRPTEFKAGVDGPPHLVVFTRAKKAGAEGSK